MPYAANAGVHIYYEVHGDGFPVLLHTGGGGDLDMWRQAGYVDGLSGYQVILVDHRGHGRSDRPTEIAAHRIERYVGDVIAVMDAVQVARVAFWGYSDGTNVGYALAAQHPERVATIIATGASSSANWQQARAQDAMEWREVLKDGMEGLNKELEQSEGGAVPEWFRSQMAGTDREMFLLEIDGWSSWEGPWSVLPTIDVPTLLMAGEMEDPNGNTLQAAHRLPHGKCVMFPGLGHVAAFVRSDIALPHAINMLEQVTDTKR